MKQDSKTIYPNDSDFHNLGVSRDIEEAASSTDISIMVSVHSIS